MRNYTITSVWGIPIRLNVSLLVFLPILAWVIGSGAQIEAYARLVDGISPTTVDPVPLQRGSTPWVVGVAAAVGLFASVAVHELGHAWAAMRYGLGVESITLWILGGIASLEQMPREWNREFWIAVAGPAASVLVAAACLAALQVLPGTLPTAVFVVGWLAVTNIVLTVFNLLPAFPMDGGRVLRAFLSRSGKRSYEDATRIAARVGTGFALLFAVVGVLSFAPMLLLLALFVYGAATSESKSVALQALLDGLTVDDVAERGGDPIPADETVAAFTERMFRDRRTTYPVAEDGTVIGVVTLADVRDVPESDRDATTVRSITDESVPRIDGSLAAFDGFVELSTNRDSVALVERDGRVVGTVSTGDFSSVMQLRAGGAAAPRGAL